MKPILFNTDMVRRLLNGEKTVTRRVVKPQPEARLVPGEKDCYIYRGIPCGLDGMTNFAPYRPGDILYVRETWRVQSARRFDADARIEFKAGGDMARIQFPGGCDQYHSRTIHRGLKNLFDRLRFCSPDFVACEKRKGRLTQKKVGGT